MKTIEDIIPGKQIREKLYSLIILNNQEYFIVDDLMMCVDRNFLENNGVYTGVGNLFTKYDVDTDKFESVKITLPSNWKYLVARYNNERELN